MGDVIGVLDRTTAAKNMPPRALITGATGQDGSYLVELLLARDYQVHAQSRRTDSTSLPQHEKFFHILIPHATCIGIPQIFVTQ